MTPPLSPDAFASELSVSRETMERLELYEALLLKWNRAINLVGRGTLSDPWRRHFLDSAQLMARLPAPPQDRPLKLIDFGSGAGFPGLVLAIMGAGEVHLVESDQRKAAFLREVSRETAAGAQVHACRIEELEPFPADVVTARALAPLPLLLTYAEAFLAPDTLCLFSKGKSAEEELTLAAQEWKMIVECLPSLSDPAALLLEIRKPRRLQPSDR